MPSDEMPDGRSFSLPSGKVRVAHLTSDDMRHMVREELRRALAECVREELLRPHGNGSRQPASPRDEEDAEEAADPKTNSTAKTCEEELEVTFPECADPEVLSADGRALNKACRSESTSSKTTDPELAAALKITGSCRMSLYAVDHEPDDVTKRNFVDHVVTHYPAFECMFRIMNITNTFGVEESPPRDDPISRLADSNAFSLLVHLMILLNCIFMWFSADEYINDYKDYERSHFAVIGDMFFLGVYGLEFVVKIFRHRLLYFYGVEWKLNWLDFALLFLSLSFEIVDAFVHVGWLRVARMLKLARALRVLQLFTAFHSLRALMVSVTSTVTTLFWSVVFLFAIYFIFALIFVLQVADYFEHAWQIDGGDPLGQAMLLRWFGSVETAILTLLGTSTGGTGWPELYDALDHTGWGNQALLMFFVAFSQIAIVNIILGVFVDKAMKALEISKEQTAFQHFEEQQEIMDNIKKVCVEADKDDSGFIHKREWRKAVQRSYYMEPYLESVGLRVDDVHKLLNSLHSDEQGGVEIDTFVTGCMNMRGHASDYDMKLLLSHVEDVMDQIKDIKEAQEKRTNLARLLAGK